MSSLLKKFIRKKVVDKDETSTELNRVLSTFDLTLLGIGSTLGIGVYVLAGSVAKDAAGPAVVLSFLVAAAASVLAGLCYAEFGSRVPKAGSAYVYSYICVGELIAFIVGWNLVMEYVIGVASVAKGYSGYVDQLFHHEISNAFNTYLPIQSAFLAPYFDLFAFTITMILTLLLAFGVKESSFFNNVFTILNLGVVLFVVVAGSFYADPKNWNLKKEDILNSTSNANITGINIGEGGFAPFGFHGVMKGAATCFYGFVGFDAIATTAEEAKNPQRAIPFSIVFSLLFIFLAYFGISTVVTMMVPYYLQNSEAPLPQAFQAVGFQTAKWIVSIGALFGLSTSLLGGMFPLPRVLYAMASDGVLFKFLAKVHPRFQTPLVATMIGGTFAGLMSAMFKLESLIDMMSIGTLTAYSLVAICVMCLRYRKDTDGADDAEPNSPEPSKSSFLGLIFNAQKARIPTDSTSSYTDWAVAVYCIFTIAFCGVAIFGEDDIIAGHVGILCLLGAFGACMIFILLSLACQPVSRVELSFRVPFLPWVPGLSILSNIYLVMKLSGITWVRFSVWMSIGFLFYAICLLNGTTDKTYAKSLESKKKRKYSQISATGFENKGIHLSNGMLEDVQQLEGKERKKLANGNCDPRMTTELDILPLSSTRNWDTDGQKLTQVVANTSSSNAPTTHHRVVDNNGDDDTVNKLSPTTITMLQGKVETETIENYPESAAVEIIGTVISEAQAKVDSKQIS